MNDTWVILVGSLVILTGLVLFGFVMGVGVGYRSRIREEGDLNA